MIKVAQDHELFPLHVITHGNSWPLTWWQQQ